ncbi:MAG: DUF3631 domain-containing protein [Herbiconiux sp.]|nr:DUF3631 domain-containing protein [Herbiconiux sp.]
MIDVNTAAARLIDKLEAVKPTGANKWVARCPSHNDGNPSLSVAAVEGRALIYCFAGCQSADIVAALKLTMNDLFDSPHELEYRYDNGRIAKRYYREGKKGFSQTNTDRAPELFKLAKVRDAVGAGRDIYICEGEEDVRAMESLGVTATTAPQGAGNWNKVDYSALKGGSDVYVVADLDKPGTDRARGLTAHLKGLGIKVAGVRTAKTGNDVADHVAAGLGLVDLMPLEIGGGADDSNHPTVDSSDAPDGFDGSQLEDVLTVLRVWFARFVSVPDDLDLDLLALWAAHTHVALETYSTPRLVLDSTMPGSGKTTVLEHFQRLAYNPVQAASISSPALLARMLSKGVRTILIDEVDRSLDPKKPGVEDLIAILNSGYKRGATRPVLVPGKGGEWDVAEMSTYAPVAMAGNAPHLPDDTRSRSIRVLLMPDLYGTVETSDWEEIEQDALELGEALASAMDAAREFIRQVRPALPPACVGRSKEKWNPLMRVATAAGGTWPQTVAALIERDLEEAAMEREEGLLKLPPQMVMLTDLRAVWEDHEQFLGSTELVRRLIAKNPDYWDVGSSYGRALTVQRLGRTLAQVKIRASKDAKDHRGYALSAFEQAWRRSGLTPRTKPSKPSEVSEPSTLDFKEKEAN